MSDSTRTKPYSILGPYPERAGWRVRVYINGKQDECKIFETQAAALAYREEKEDKLCRLRHRKLTEVIDEWGQYRVNLGTCKPETTAGQAAHLRTFLAPDLNRQLREITPKRAAFLYERILTTPSRRTGKPPAVATRREYVKHAKGLFAWAIEREYLRENPFAGINVLGKNNRGKPQLRIDEARSFLETALRHYQETRNPLALAVASALYMGLRTGELLNREVRDLEDGGRYLCIDRGKTDNATRRPEVPEPIRPYLLELARGQPPSAPLFGFNALGGRRRRQAVWAMTSRICRLAGLPHVCTHSLRGLFATLAVQSGAVTHAVAAVLGHGSFAITARHYAQANALTSAQVDRVSDVLAPSAPDSAPEAPVPARLTAEQILTMLDPSELARLGTLLPQSAEDVRRKLSAEPSADPVSRRRRCKSSSSEEE
jgi:integrase